MSLNNYTLQFKSADGNGATASIDLLNVKKAALVLRAINHKLRQQILKLIDSEGRLNVTQIFVRLRIEQSVASQHLAILRRAGIVNVERDKKFIYYTVNTERIAQTNEFVKGLLKGQVTATA